MVDYNFGPFYAISTGIEQTKDINEKLRLCEEGLLLLPSFVSACLNEDEATLKRIRLFEDHIILEEENPMYKPMVFWGEETNRGRIIGKATHFISAVR